MILRKTKSGEDVLLVMRVNKIFVSQATDIRVPVLER